MRKFRISAAAWRERGGKDVSTIKTFDDLPLYWRGSIMKDHARLGDDVVKFISAENGPDGMVDIMTEGERLVAA